MTQQKKQDLATALKFVYDVATKAAVEKKIHDICENAAKELMKFIEEIEVEE